MEEKKESRKTRDFQKIKQKKQRRASIQKLYKLLIICIFTLILLIGVLVAAAINSKPSSSTGNSSPGSQSENSTPPSEAPSGSDSEAPSVSESESESESDSSTEDTLSPQKAALIADADYLALTYDYDKAIALIKTWEGYDQDTVLSAKLSEYEAQKASCVRVDISKVTHIFYHSLVVDPIRAFNPKNPQAKGNNEWMTTVSEFNKITQEMYDRGYVLVSIHDLYRYETDANGNKVMVEGDIYLPPDKKAFVLSLDDLCYYHSYDNQGYASKLVLDENGDVINEYYDAEGNLHYGLYDCVPLLDKFVREHPDASYRGAKGTVALTGYNGILGYRTDESYTLDNVNNPNINYDKRQWLKKHPDFKLEAERAAAKEVADVMKANGWNFASHTWGHLSVGEKSLSTLKRDNEKWQKNVASIVGETNVIIFAHGTDLGGWGNYSSTNEKFNYFHSQGFDIFCNVDSSSPYLTHFGKTYLRQGRRNLDGFRFHYNLIGQQNNLSDLFDIADIVDPDRPSLDSYN